MPTNSFIHNGITNYKNLKKLMTIGNAILQGKGITIMMYLELTRNMLNVTSCIQHICAQEIGIKRTIDVCLCYDVLRMFT